MICNFSQTVVEHLFNWQIFYFPLALLIIESVAKYTTSVAGNLDVRNLRYIIIILHFSTLRSIKLIVIRIRRFVHIYVRSSVQSVSAKTDGASVDYSMFRLVAC